MVGPLLSLAGLRSNWTQLLPARGGALRGMPHGDGRDNDRYDPDSKFFERGGPRPKNNPSSRGAPS